MVLQLNVNVKGKGFPILCLHGHPGSGQCMSVFTDRLSQRFQTFSPDLRGYGKSRTTENFDMEDHLADLEALLDRFGIQQCLVLGVTRQLGGAERGVTLDDEQFAAVDVVTPAVGELGR